MTVFYTGIHRQIWMRRDDYAGIPVCVSHSIMAPRKTFHQARQPVLLDSGGFSYLKKHGRFPFTTRQYVADIQRIIKGIGRMPDAVAHMDAMTENPVILGTPHLPPGHRNYFHGTRAWRGIPDDQPDEPIEIAEFKHQWWTVTNYLECARIDPDLPWMAVLQGRNLESYIRCYDMYRRAGVDLRHLPMVAVGSVCRREATHEIGEIFSVLQMELGLDNLHGFGVKTRGLELYAEHVNTADSMAWSEGLSRRPPLPGHEELHPNAANCANCPIAALEWRQRLVSNLASPRRRRLYQPRLWLRREEAIA
jgi:hypothetical protein